MNKEWYRHNIWEEIVTGVPQGSILDQFLLNIFLCNLLLSIESNYFTNYADDTTYCIIGNDAAEVQSELKTIAEEYFLNLPNTK